MKLLPMLGFLVLTAAARAQQYAPNPERADSIRHMLKQQYIDDTTKLKLLVALKYVVTREEREAVVLEAFQWLEQQLPVAGKSQQEVMTSSIGEEALLSPSVLYQMRGNEGKMMEFAQSAVRVAEQNGNAQFLLRAQCNLLFAHMAIGNIDTAVRIGHSMEQGVAAKKTSVDFQAVYAALMHECYRRKGELSQAADWSYKMLSVATTVPDKINARGELAQDYIFLQEYDKALKEIDQGLQLLQTDGNSENQPSGNRSVTDMRIQYLELTQKAIECWLAKDSLPKARLLAEVCLARAKEINAPVYLSQAYQYMGDVELKAQNHRRAIEWYEAFLQLAEEQGPGQNFTHTAVLLNLGKAHLALGNLAKALEYAKKAEAMGASSQFAFLHLNIKSLLSRIYRAQGQYGEALQYYEGFVALRDSIHSMESNRALIRQQMQYDFDQQDLARRQSRNALLAGGAFLALLVVFFWQRTRLKQRALALISAEKTEADRQRRRAEASEAFKARFLAHMSHEIRTPLHGIAGFTDLLLETALTEKQRRWLSSIHHSTGRLGEVVNDILDLSKLEAGKVTLRQVPFSPARIAADVQESLALRAESKSLELQLDIAKDVPPVVLGDPTRLYQILMNLVGNAVKFTEQGEVRLTVEGGGWKVEGDTPSTFHLLSSTIFFSVSDTGIGIPVEQLDQVFGSFQQAGEDTTARFGGTGLGLTIARELVQLHGSDIWVESEVGKGSTFSFPIAFPLASAAELEQETPGNDALYFTAPLKILLADDNALNREIAAEALRRHFDKVEIVEAADGREATQRAQQEPFDLILMDLQMPEMSGLEATRYIRQHISMEVPIIALTASATPEEIDSALAAGMNRHLSKPFKSQELARAIAEELGLATFRKMETFGKVESSSFLRDFCEGDEALMQHFIQKFMEQYPLEIKRLEAAVKAVDREALYQAAHSLAPQLEFVGLKTAAELAQKLIQGARANLAFSRLADWVEEIKVLLEQAPDLLSMLSLKTDEA